MGLPSALYEPSRLAEVCWQLIWPAVYLGTLSSGASLVGRVIALEATSSRMPTFARILPVIGLTTAGLPLISWGIHATFTLLMLCEVVFTGHGDPDLFPAYFLMVPVSGLGAVAIDRACGRVSRSPQTVAHFRDSMILSTVSACWTFVVVVLAFRWDT